MTDGEVHCARCGDYEPEPRDDWRCPECGSPSTAGGESANPVLAMVDETHKGRRILIACCTLTALILVAPPVVGVIAKVVWRSLLWGWGLVP